tara:strand:- start:401 stop:646 length:246 start_codon:yes stop_codon:yes gene_type:complete
MEKTNYKEELLRYQVETGERLVAIEQRVISIFKAVSRLEKHAEKQNGRLTKTESQITKIMTVGAVGVFAIPLFITLIMRYL